MLRTPQQHPFHSFVEPKRLAKSPNDLHSGPVGDTELSSEENARKSRLFGEIAAGIAPGRLNSWRLAQAAILGMSRKPDAKHRDKLIITDDVLVEMGGHDLTSGRRRRAAFGFFGRRQRQQITQDGVIAAHDNDFTLDAAATSNSPHGRALRAIEYAARCEENMFTKQATAAGKAPVGVILQPLWDRHAPLAGAQSVRAISDYLSETAPKMETADLPKLSAVEWNAVVDYAYTLSTSLQQQFNDASVDAASNRTLDASNKVVTDSDFGTL